MTSASIDWQQEREEEAEACHMARCAASRNWSFLRQQWLYHVPVHVCQAAVHAVVAEDELLVIDAEQVQDRGMNVVDLRGFAAIERLVAPFVAGSMSDTAA